MAKMSPQQANTFLQGVAAGGKAPATQILPASPATALSPETKKANENEQKATEAVKKEQEEVQRKGDADLAKAKESEGTINSAVVRPISFAVGKLPDPGSIVFPLFTLLILLFFLVPYSGQTRAVKLWNVLTGSATTQIDTSGAQTALQNLENQTGIGGAQ